MLRVWTRISLLLLTTFILVLWTVQRIAEQVIHDHIFTYVNGVLYSTPGYRGLTIGDAERRLSYLLSRDSGGSMVDGGVSWSADGRHFTYMGYVSNGGLTGDFYVVTMTDFYFHNRLTFPSTSYRSIWNAEKLTFVVSERSDKSKVKPINDYLTVTDLRSGANLYVSQSGDFDADIIVSQPAWSPDGRMLTLITSTPDYLKRTLRMVNLDQGRVITPSLPESVRDAEAPFWSPDGKYVAFYATTNFAKTLWIADSQTGDSREISQKFDFGPGWSPDSQHIAYTVGENIAGSIHRILYIADIMTGQNRVLTEFSDLAYYPIWSPDGRWLAILSTTDSGLALYIVDAVTGESQELASMPDTSVDSQPVWSADGQWLTVNTTLYLSHTTYLTKTYLVDVAHRAIVSTLTDSGWLGWQP